MSEPPEYLDSVGRLLGFAFRATGALTTEILSEFDLTTPQWIALTALWRQDGMTITALAEYTKSSPAAASKLVDRMERNDLVERRSESSDRRKVKVWLTKNGQAKRDVISVFEDVNAVLLDGFSEAEAKRARKYLQRMIDNAVRRYGELRPGDPLSLDS